MSIHAIASEALNCKVLTAQQEHEIAMLLRQGHCNQLDRRALNSLLVALRHNQVRYANPLAISPIS